LILLFVIELVPTVISPLQVEHTQSTGNDLPPAHPHLRQPLAVPVQIEYAVRVHRRAQGQRRERRVKLPGIKQADVVLLERISEPGTAS